MSKGVEVGDRIKITSESYDEELRRKTWRVEKIAWSTEDHPLYDSGVGGPMISCRGLPFCLYAFEFEIVAK